MGLRWALLLSALLSTVQAGIECTNGQLIDLMEHNKSCLCDAFSRKAVSGCEVLNDEYKSACSQIVDSNDVSCCTPPRWIYKEINETVVKAFADLGALIPERKYTGVSVGTCKGSDLLVRAETSVRVSDEGCRNYLEVEFAWEQLDTKCGFRRKAHAEVDRLVAQVSGDVVVTYKDGDTPGELVFPIAISLPLEPFVEPMLAEFSVWTDETNTKILFALPYPFAIDEWDTFPEAIGSEVASGNARTLSQPKVCDAAAGDYATDQRYCDQYAEIVIKHGTACSVDGVYVLHRVKVTCGSNVPKEDCDLPFVGAGSYISVKVNLHTNRNLCEGERPVKPEEAEARVLEFVTLAGEERKAVKKYFSPVTVPPKHTRVMRVKFGGRRIDDVTIDRIEVLLDGEKDRRAASAVAFEKDTQTFYLIYDHPTDQKYKDPKRPEVKIEGNFELVYSEASGKAPKSSKVRAVSQGTVGVPKKSLQENTGTGTVKKPPKREEL